MNSYVVLLCKPGEYSAFLKHVVQAASLAAACEVAAVIAKNGHRCIWEDRPQGLVINKWKQATDGRKQDNKRKRVGECVGDTPLEVLSIRKATSLWQ